MAWLFLGRRSAPLWLRLGLPISLIIALAIGFISFLNYYNYRKTYQQLNVARIMVVAHDLRQAIESGLNVGLAPRSNTSRAADLTFLSVFARVCHRNVRGWPRSAAYRPKLFHHHHACLRRYAGIVEPQLL
jgi:hypothetical protein